MATAEGPDNYSVADVRVGSVLNIRSSPSSLGTRIGTIPFDGDGIANLGRVGGLDFADWEKATEEERTRAIKTRWCRVGHNLTVGWVAAWFLAEGSAEGKFQAGDAMSVIAGSEWTLRDCAAKQTNIGAWIAFREDKTRELWLQRV